jgi:hypothetical protein
MRLESAPAKTAWALWGFSLLLGASAIAMALASGTRGVPWEDVVIATVFPTVGALVASRHPRNVVGWMFIGAGVFSQIYVFTAVYANFSVSTHELPLLTFVVWLNSWLWTPSLATISLLLLLYFPDGRPASKRWRPVAFGTIGLIVVGMTAIALLPFSVSAPNYHLRNPIGVEWLGRHLALMGLVLGLPYLVAVTAAATSLVIRMRRAVGDERQQMKWFVFGSSVLIVALIISTFGNADWASMIGVVAIAVAPCVAILRYRLYDIDRIINRTVVYAIVSGLLAGCYFAVVLLLSLIAPVATDSPAVVAVATLGVAALFRPARGRVQVLIDRRFNRARYDAQTTLETFSAHLRDEVDIDSLGAQLMDVVTDIMEPRYVTLSLVQRETEARA